VTATHAAESDIKQLPNLLHGEESVLYGDQAYWKEADRQALEEQGVRYRVNRRAPGGNRHLSPRWRRINRARSRTRARCEHPFRVIKRLWGFDKTRYRGIHKNLARAQTMFALARRPLPAAPTAGDVRPVTDERHPIHAQTPGQGEGSPFNRHFPSVWRRRNAAYAEVP
jgi:IS5 family transposase